MSATNKTTHYELPVFVGGDMPGWLTDFNGAMNTIDGAIYEAKSAGDGAQSSADTANTNITTLSGTVDGIGGRVTTLESTVASQGGNIDTINSLIGHGEPTTTDKTIIGAINELAAEMPSGNVDADDVAYDNTTSGLTADDVQSAIDELETEIQAIQPSGGADLNFVTSGDFTVTAVSGLSVHSDATSTKYLLNTDKSIGKIYGGIRLDGSLTTVANTWIKLATLTSTDFPTIAASYNIEVGYTNILISTAAGYVLTRLKFNTDGSIDIEMYAPAVFTLENAYINLPPCIYILKDLGD